MKRKTCVPHQLPPRSLCWDNFAELAWKAHATIARYDEVLSSVEHPQSVFSFLTYEWALVSSEQRKTSLEDIFMGSGGDKVIDYRLAYLVAAKSIENRPISLALMRKIHAGIAKEFSWPKDEIGRFRKRQNWIGPEGRGIEEAYFFPPDARILDRCMKNLLTYSRAKESDPLVQLAIFFAQLLIIHPFMDGNGRVGRILIPLFLQKKKLTTVPMFYLSTYFRTHRLEYFERLFAITASNDWEGWIRFFLSGIIEEGRSATRKAKAILSLYHEFLETTQGMEGAKSVVDALFSSLICDKKRWKGNRKALDVLKKLEGKGLIAFNKTKSMVTVVKLLPIDPL